MVMIRGAWHLVFKIFWKIWVRRKVGSIGKHSFIDSQQAVYGRNPWLNPWSRLR